VGPEKWFHGRASPIFSRAAQLRPPAIGREGSWRLKVVQLYETLARRQGFLVAGFLFRAEFERKLSEPFPVTRRGRPVGSLRDGIDGAKAYDVGGHYVGRVREFFIEPAEVPSRVALLIGRAATFSLLARHDQMARWQWGNWSLNVSERPWNYRPNESWLAVQKDLLDQQIIDIARAEKWCA